MALEMDWTLTGGVVMTDAYLKAEILKYGKEKIMVKVEAWLDEDSSNDIDCQPAATVTYLFPYNSENTTAALPEAYGLLKDHDDFDGAVDA